MHGDHAFSIVFRDINSSIDSTLNKNWLSNTVFSLVKSKSMESRLFNIEHIIKPVVNMFKDYKGKMCLSIILGYGYRFSCSVDELGNELMQLNSELFRNIALLLKKEYDMHPYCIGDCPDSSFVEFERKKNTSSLNTITFDFSVGGESETDVYYWRVPNYSSFKLETPDSSIIYSLFPKEKIILSKKENLRVGIDPFKLLKK